MTDFFGNVQNVELTKNRYPLSEEFDNETTTLVDEEARDNQTTTVKKPINQHLYHSFLVEKKSNVNFYMQSIFGLLSTVTIGYVVSTTLM